MKRLFFLYTLLATFMNVLGDNGTLHVKGNLLHAGDTLWVMKAHDMDQKMTVLVKDNIFEFDYPLDHTTMIYIVSPSVFRREHKGVNVQLLAVADEYVRLEGDAFGDIIISGSRLYENIGKLELFVKETEKEMKALNEHCSKMIKEGIREDSVMNYYQSHSAQLSLQAETARLNYMREHADEDATVAMITHLKSRKIKEAVFLLSDRVRNGRMKPFYQALLDQINEGQRMDEMNARKQAAGIVAPDFTLNDIHGKPLSLSSMRGQYVVLDFWGSWCGWCIKGFPVMKEYYKKYKGKFEIIGIDCNDTEQKWKDAVIKHELPWLHVYNPEKTTLLADYGISGFPTKIIISPDGTIVKSCVGEGEEFYTFLDELFK